MTRAKQYQEFWQNLSLLVDTGMGVLGILKILEIGYRDEASCADDEYMANICHDLIAGIKDGNCLSEIMPVTGMFTDIEAVVIRTAEWSGTLEKQLIRLVENSVWTKALEYKNFWSTFGELIAAGTPTLEAINIAAGICSGKLKEAVLQVSIIAKDGITLVNAMKYTKAFSDYELRKVYLGELADSLDKAIEQIVANC